MRNEPEGFIDPMKLQRLTLLVGQVTAAAGDINVDADRIVKDGCVLAPAKKLRRKEQVARWRELYPARDMILSVAMALRHAASRLEAEWERTEEEICGLHTK